MSGLTMPGVRERRVVASLLTYWAGRRGAHGEIYFSEEKYMNATELLYTSISWG
jgi:hypothetical protein